MTFWTGNHPLARGEGDLAANPEHQARGARRSGGRIPGLTPEAARAALLPRGLRAGSRGHPALVARAARAQGVLHGRADRPVVCATLDEILASRRSCRTCSCCRSRSPGARRLARAARRPTALLLLAASAVLVCLVFFPQERFRIPVIDPDADRLRRRRWLAAPVVNTLTDTSSSSSRPTTSGTTCRARARRARARRLPACWSSTTARRTAPARSPTRSPPSIRAASRSCTAPGRAASGRSYIDGLQQAIAHDRRRPDLPDGRRPLAQSRVPAGARRRGGRLRRRDRLALPERRQRRELAAAPDLPQRVRQPLHPRRDAA